jgi:hypothetical protein
MLDDVVPLSAVASSYRRRFSEGGMATVFSKGICSGRLSMSALLLSLSGGAGWWPLPSISCVWHANWERLRTDHGKAKSAR